MTTNQYTVVGLGELLWDLFPAGEQLGGAPANVAYMTTLLGDCGMVASRVGADALGRRALEQLQECGLTTSYVQLDTVHATGTVRVQLDEEGKPQFTINEDAAWEALEWTAEWQELATQANAICFGALAQRSPQSRQTIRRFLDAARDEALIVFDVNLRAPFYTAAIVIESLRRAHIVKLNDEELPLLMSLCGLQGGSAEDCLRRLLGVYDLQMVGLTRGAHGSLLVTATDTVEHNGFKIAVVDTVGAGDAFTAALIYHYRRGATLATISAAANRLGAWVATQIGATPPADEKVCAAIIAAPK
ncbi:MAG: carbohydrate kinase [Acidobacteria bacterium]|nr:carbohydrate kinase [Acidobacteriota bacterium]